MKKIKAILFVLLLVTFLVLILIPTTYAGFEEMPGIFKGPGPFGETCECPHTPSQCGCVIIRK